MNIQQRKMNHPLKDGGADKKGKCILKGEKRKSSKYCYHPCFMSEKFEAR